MCTRENIKVSISIIYGILDSRQFLSVDYLLPGGGGGGGGGGREGRNLPDFFAFCPKCFLINRSGVGIIFVGG
jgi:hypothetical protein